MLCGLIGSNSPGMLSIGVERPDREPFAVPLLARRLDRVDGRLRRQPPFGCPLQGRRLRLSPRSLSTRRCKPRPARRAISIHWSVSFARPSIMKRLPASARMMAGVTHCQPLFIGSGSRPSHIENRIGRGRDHRFLNLLDRGHGLRAARLGRQARHRRGHRSRHYRHCHHCHEQEDVSVPQHGCSSASRIVATVGAYRKRVTPRFR